jgi:uroporphyrinogen-III synthase
MRIVLTHPEPRVSAVARALRTRGHAVLELPLRQLTSLVDAPAVRARLATAAAFDWLAFVSPGAVDAALPALVAAQSWLPHRGIALIGPGTEAALRAHGLAPTPACPWVRPAAPPFDADALLREPAFDAGPDDSLLVVRGETGRDDWLEALRARGVRVEIAAVLRSVPIEPTPAAVGQADRWLREAGETPVAFVFTTVDAIDRLDAVLSRELRDTARACAVHPRQVARLYAQGWRQPELLEPGEAGLLAGIESGGSAHRARPAAR